MSLVVRKAVFGVSDLVRHKPVCTATEDRHVKFSKKKCGTARDDELSTSNFWARAARHLHNEFKNSFQGDGMDNSNKHS